MMQFPVIPSTFPQVSESHAVQTLAQQVAMQIATYGYDTIVRCLPQIMKSLHADTSRRVYLQDILHFTTWLQDRELIPVQLTYESMTDYYNHLETWRKKNGEHYSRATINRMFAVASTVLQEHVKRDLLPTNPCKGVSLKASGDETTHAVLDEKQAKQVLQSINTTTIRGKMHYAIVSLLLRTGIRRDECRMLNIGDIQVTQGHHIAILENAKGGDRQKVKIPPDVWRYIEEYMQALQETYPRHDARLEAPLFIALRKGDHPSLRHDATGKMVEQRIDVKAIEAMVKALGEVIGVPDLTPHGLRATFITLAMENGATLEQTQYAARHKDPRTTERYRKRKFNLDKNAVDKLSFLARDEE
jgi:integrase/recombinase XerD